MPKRIDFDRKTGNIGLIGTYAKIYYTLEGEPVAPSSIEGKSIFTMVIEFDLLELRQGVDLRGTIESAQIIHSAEMSWAKENDTLILTLDYMLSTIVERGRGFLIGMGRLIAIFLSSEIGADW